jgi:hypothetical protein
MSFVCFGGLGDMVALSYAPASVVMPGKYMPVKILGTYLALPYALAY